MFCLFVTSVFQCRRHWGHNRQGEQWSSAFTLLVRAAGNCISCIWEGPTQGTHSEGCLLQKDLAVLSLLTMVDRYGDSWPVPLLKGEEKKRSYDSDGSTHILGKSRTLFLFWRLFLSTGAGDYFTPDTSVTNGTTFSIFFFFFLTHISLPL